MAEAPSNTTVVLVEVTGKPDSDEPLRKIEFTSSYQYYRRQVARPVSIKRVVEIGSIGSFDKPDKSYIAFWFFTRAREHYGYCSAPLSQNQTCHSESAD